MLTSYQTDQLISLIVETNNILHKIKTLDLSERNLNLENDETV